MTASFNSMARRDVDLGSIVVVAEGAVPKEGTMATVSGEVDQFGHVRLGGMRLAISASVDRSGSDSRNRPETCERRIRFSAARYSHWRSRRWFTRPVMYFAT